MSRVAKTALGAAVLGSLLLGGASALGAATPAGGTIKVWGTPSTNGSGGTIVITGVIGDSGKTVRVNSAGKADKKGTFSQFLLKKGTIVVDSTQVQAALKSGASPPADFNTATCSGSDIASAPVPIVSGTKAYAGITGSLTVSLSFAVAIPLTSSGKCNTNNPGAQTGFITGSGTVSFS
jgi:hypothetical protein